MTRARLAVLALLLCSSAAAFAQMIDSIRPTVLPTGGGAIEILTGINVDCASICNMTVLIGGEVVPKSNVYMWGRVLSVLVPPHAAGYADFEWQHPYGAPAIIKNAILFVGPDDYETVLLPVTVARNTAIPGAFDSLWTATTTVVNDSNLTFNIDVPWGDPRLLISPPPPQHVTIEPFQTAYLDLAMGGPLVVRIPKAIADKVSFQTRVHDQSRAATNFGTHIPSVRERDFYTTRTIITDVPSADPFRSTLRIYSPDGNRRTFNVTVMSQPKILLSPYVQQGQQPRVLAQLRASTDRQSDLPYIPPSAELLLVGSGGEPVQVIVEPVDDGLAPFYAFVSVTNNETQHVTVLTPR